MPPWWRRGALRLLVLAAAQLASPLASGQEGEFLSAPSAAPAAAPVQAPSRRASFAFFDAQGLNAGQFGFAAALGFPVAHVSAGYGVTRRLDVRLTFQTLYGLFLQPGLVAKMRVAGGDGEGLAMAVRLGAAWAFFAEGSHVDRGARWITGARDIAVPLAFTVSGRSARGISFLAEIGVETTFDLSPRQDLPLTGPPPQFTVGANVPMHFGVELPISRRFNAVFLAGMDLHLRGEDSVTMPYVIFGVTFGSGSPDERVEQR